MTIKLYKEPKLERPDLICGWPGIGKIRIMPGGLGTVDEITEILTLMQTHKIKPFPVILFDSEYWQGFLEWLRGFAPDRGMISAKDFEPLRVCDESDAVVNIVQKWCVQHEIIG